LATYGIEGDVFEVLPKLISSFKGALREVSEINNKDLSDDLPALILPPSQSASKERLCPWIRSTKNPIRLEASSDSSFTSCTIAKEV